MTFKEKGKTLKNQEDVMKGSLFNCVISSSRSWHKVSLMTAIPVFLSLQRQIKCLAYTKDKNQSRRYKE